MDYRDRSDLTVKVGNSHGNVGVSAFIREQLESIPEGKALAMVDLVKAVRKNCPTVPDRRQGYVRINNVLSRDERWIKLTGSDGYTYIARREVEEKKEYMVEEAHESECKCDDCTGAYRDEDDALDRGEE